MKNQRKTTEKFIADARCVHGEKYDYCKDNIYTISPLIGSKLSLNYYLIIIFMVLSPILTIATSPHLRFEAIVVVPSIALFSPTSTPAAL